MPHFAPPQSNQGTKLITSWWLQFNPFKQYSRQIGSNYTQISGYKNHKQKHVETTTWNYIHNDMCSIVLHAFLISKSVVILCMSNNKVFYVTYHFRTFLFLLVQGVNTSTLFSSTFHDPFRHATKTVKRHPETGRFRRNFHLPSEEGKWWHSKNLVFFFRRLEAWRTIPFSKYSQQPWQGLGLGFCGSTLMAEIHGL